MGKLLGLLNEKLLELVDREASVFHSLLVVTRITPNAAACTVNSRRCGIF